MGRLSRAATISCMSHERRRVRETCPHCGDVVGVYEPVVWVQPPEGEGPSPRAWHESCFDEANRSADDAAR